MQDPRMPFSEETPDQRPQKKTAKPKKKAVNEGGRGALPKAAARASSKRASSAEKSNSDTSAASVNEYRVLRRKYLLLEEESCSVGSDLKGVEDEVKSLEDEKSALLDKLVVLEGLIDASQLHSHSQGKL